MKLFLWDFEKFVKTIINTYQSQSHKKYSTDLGNLIGNFDCEYSKVWKFSNFLATLILCEINFSWFQRLKNCCFNNLAGFEFWVFGYFTLENVKCSQKFEIQSYIFSQNCSFWGLQNYQNWLHVKIWVAEESWNFHIVSSQLGCPSLYLNVVIKRGLSRFEALY